MLAAAHQAVARLAMSDGPGAFGLLLSQYRAAAGLSQEELAELAGLSRRGISNLERGERRLPHPATVRRLADALRLDSVGRAKLLASSRRPATVAEPGIGATRPGQNVRASAPQPRTSPPQPRSATLPLVGRRAEWNQLQAAWRDASRGSPAVVVLAGEPGIGKTRLAEEMLAWASGQGIGTAMGRAYAAEGRLSYGPVVDWLRSDTLRPTLRQLDTRSLTEVGRLLPDLLGDGPSNRPDSPAEPQQRQVFFRSLAQATLSTRQPLLLLLDDLHWCDQDTLEWLHYLLRFDTTAALLIAGTVRPEEVGPEHPLAPLLSDLRRRGQLIEVPLGPLDAAEVAELAASVAGHDINPEDLRQLYDETEGQPLFVVETIRASLGNSDAQTRSRGPLAPTSGTSVDPVSGQIPPRVHAVIAARLAQLSESARETVRLAATIGRSFTLDLLVEAGAGDINTLVGPLDELWERQIVREHGATAYDFAHDKIREVAYAEIRPAQRALLHRRVAHALERAHAADPDPVSAQLAANFDRAGLADRAVDYYQRAASFAQRVYANQEAIGLLNRALVLLASLPPSQARDKRELAVYTALGVSLVATRGYAAAEVMTAYQRSHVLSQLVGKPSSPPALRALAIAALSHTEFQLARDLGNQLLDYAERQNDRVVLVEAHYVLGVTAFWTGRFADARAHLEDALASYTPERSPIHIATFTQDPAVVCLMRLALVLWFLGEAELAAQREEESLALGRQVSHPFSQAYSLVWDAVLHALRRDFRATRVQAEAAIALSREHGLEMWHAQATPLRGWALAEAGEIQAGIEEMHKGMDAFHATGNRFLQPLYMGMLAEQYAQIGRLDGGLLLVDEALATVQQTGERCWEADLYWRKGVLLQQRHADKAVVAFEHAQEIARRQRARAIADRAAASLAAFKSMPPFAPR
jgi:predicted ATPase/transcriptional regulator with XRE-family HTH domain